MDSVILLNKPTGMTSFDAVAKCRRILHEKKTGHTGTLDPNASGLMIVLTGKYTKLLPYCKKDRKVYHAEFSLGKKSDTGDIWGTVLDEKEPRMHTKDELEEAAASLTGNILQVPPMYSAIRKDGKRLYEYARKGIEIEREARPATVFSLDVHTENGIDFTMDATVSSGTYVRTLITDFAEKLGEYPETLSLMSSYDLLIVDDFGLMNLDLDKCRNLFEVFDCRDPYKSILLVSQIPVNAWYDIFSDHTYAEASLARVLNESYRLEMNGKNMRNFEPINKR